MDSPQAKSFQPESQKAPELPPDPTYGYTLETLLEVQAPEAPAGFSDRWRGWFKKATQLDPRPVIHDTGRVRSDWKIFEINYRSTDEVLITGWLLVPKSGGAKRGFVVGHGYGGCPGPESHLPFPDAAILFPCARGISKSKHPNIPSQANDLVLHRIHTAAVDPKTKSPHPKTRIELALEESRYSVDPFKRLEEQVKDAISKLKPLIPLSFETVRLAFKVPGSAYGSVSQLLRSRQQKEGWLEDGSWACVIECPAGMKGEIIGQVMRRSSEAEVKELGS